MPIYEYVCSDCGQRFEKIVLGNVNGVNCPHCSSGNHQLQLSVFSPKSSGERASRSGACGCTPKSCGCH